jgi:dipeptidyl aminopeptidase/acylaminoacyl peptidase
MISGGWGNETVDKTIVKKIIYLSDGLKIQGYLAYPKDQSKKYPCIIWCRGGYGDDGTIDDFNAQGIFGQIASWGYVVFASQYRGNTNSEGIDEFGGNDLNDILNIIPLADEIPCADKNIWGIEGWSRGGMMTYLALTQTNIFKAAIVCGGISNLHCEVEESEFRNILLIKDSHSGVESIYSKCFSRSVINFPEKICNTTALVLLHGTKDDRISYQDSIKLSERLTELNRNHKLILIEGGDHFLKSHRKEVDQIRKEWFEKYLK